MCTFRLIFLYSFTLRSYFIWKSALYSYLENINRYSISAINKEIRDGNKCSVGKSMFTGCMLGMRRSLKIFNKVCPDTWLISWITPQLMESSWIQGLWGATSRNESTPSHRYLYTTEQRCQIQPACCFTNMQDVQEGRWDKGSSSGEMYCSQKYQTGKPSHTTRYCSRQYLLPNHHTRWWSYGTSYPWLHPCHCSQQSTLSQRQDVP